MLFQEFIHTTADKANLLYALEGSGGMFSRKTLKSVECRQIFLLACRPVADPGIDRRNKQ